MPGLSNLTAPGVTLCPDDPPPTKSSLFLAVWSPPELGCSLGTLLGSTGLWHLGFSEAPCQLAAKGFSDKDVGSEQKMTESHSHEASYMKEPGDHLS